MAQRDKPDVILLDIMLPDMDGLTVLKDLKNEEATRSIPVIIVSGKEADAQIKQALEGGAVDYVIKPFDPMELGTRLARFSGYHSQADRNRSWICLRPPRINRHLEAQFHDTPHAPADASRHAPSERVPAGTPRSSLGEILIDIGVITPEQLSQALAMVNGSERELGKALVDLNFTTEEKIMKGLGIKAKVPYFISLDGLYQPGVREHFVGRAGPAAPGRPALQDR